MSMDLQRFHATFFEESREGLDAMEAGLLALEDGQQDPEIINSVFRAAHSIKGGAGTFGFEAIAGLTHVLETLLDELRAGKRALESAAVDAMLSSVDVLRALLREAEHGQAADPAAVAAVKARLEAVLSGQAVAPVAAKQEEAAAEPEGWQIGFVPAPSLFMSGNDPLRIIRELETLGQLQVDARMERLPGFEQMDPLEAYIAWDLGLTGRIPRSKIEDTFAWVVDDCELDIQPIIAPPSLATSAPSPAQEVAAEVAAAVRPAAAAANAPAGASHEAESSIRVSVDKVDALINLVGELVITQAMLAQNSRGLDAGAYQQLLAGLADLDRNTRDLQESVMSIRMIPMSIVFSRFPRMLRDLANKLGKKVDMVTLGEATELDKGLVEKITDPLTHLVRNSCDHGIEMPAERLAKGKPEHGTITLSAAHQGGSIVIEVRDDGKGLSREKILSKARERGLDVSDQMSDADVWQLIFAPGFSTADQVTDVSGRGVGMDVVKRNIAALNGTVEIDSAEGYGMKVSVRLPLTLAIMDGMSVGVSDEVYILPLSSVVESFQVNANDVSTVAQGSQLVKVRDEYMPVIALEKIFQVPRFDSSKSSNIMVVVEADGSRVALLVDELLGQHQVVVKNLESNYRKVPNVSGATILGDGTVALILDTGGLVRRARH